MKKLNYIIAIMMLFTSFGCRTYKGYREYTEKIDLDVKHENVVNTSYNLKVIDNKLTVFENKKINYIQNVRIDEVEEKIYTDKNGTLGHLIFSPLLLAISPFAVLTMSEEKVEFEKNTYIYSGGRQAWNYFNIFMNLTGKPDSIEKSIQNSTISEEMRDKTTSHIVNIPINITIDGKNHVVKNNISKFELAELTFKNPIPNQSKEISATIKNTTIYIEINSDILYNFAKKIQTCNVIDELLNIFNQPTATKYDILLVEKKLDTLIPSNIDACKALIKIYSSNYFNHINKPILTDNIKKSKIIEYTKILEQKESEIRLAELKRQEEIQKQKEIAKIAELKRQEEIQKQKEAARIAELKKQEEIQKQKEVKRLAELKRQEEIRKQQEEEKIAELKQEEEKKSNKDNIISSSDIENSIPSSTNNINELDTENYNTSYSNKSLSKIYYNILLIILICWIILGIIGLIAGFFSGQYLYENKLDAFGSCVLALILLLLIYDGMLGINMGPNISDRFFKLNDWMYPIAAIITILLTVPFSLKVVFGAKWKIIFYLPAKLFLGLIASICIFYLINKTFEAFTSKSRNTAVKAALIVTLILVPLTTGVLKLIKFFTKKPSITE